MKQIISALSLGFLGIITTQAATTTYIGETGTNDSIGFATNWDLGLPTAQNDGLINSAAELGSLDVNTPGTVTINHTAGDIGDPNDEFTFRDATFQNSNGSGSLVMNISNSAAISDFRVLTIAGTNTVTNISGGSFNAFSVGGARIQTASNGVLNFSGGTFDNGYFWTAGTSTINLTGGVSTSASQGFRASDAGSSIIFSGDYSLTSWKSDGTVFQPIDGDYNFLSQWNGSIVDRDASSVWTDTEWIAEMTTAGVAVDGTLVTAGNFANFFNVDQTGTLTAVPEPSSTALFGLGGLALILRRRK